MKRSSFTTLSLGTAAFASLTLLAGCEKQKEAGIYKDVSSCVADGYSQSECQKAMDTAAAQHVALAPKYDSKANCEGDFGSNQCQQTVSQGHVSFFPYYWWYMMGRSSVVSQPVYRDSSGYFRSSRGSELSSSPGRTFLYESVATAHPSISTSTVERGGFGSFGESFHSGGFGG
jgi:uncharacterized protein YgiB involved in biofilm formation